MAALLYATNKFPGDGVTTQFEFAFSGGYMAKADVKAYIENQTTFARTPVTVTEAMFVNATTLNLGVSAPVGSSMVIYRDTVKTGPVVDFTGGSRITESNLDKVAQQGVFIGAETADATNQDAIAQISLSAGAAATSAAAALTSQNAAAASATAASGSATTASTQATNAATSATAASGSASAAATSATNAAASATTATTQASNASTSATNAASSATASAASAAAALTSEGNAATSATNSATSATASAASATAAAASYDSFDDRYLGAKGSAPTLDNDGNALITGALYFNTGLGAMYTWTGATWVAAFSADTGVPQLHVNDIVNGDFRIAQAGTSFAAPSIGAYDLDGWLNINTSAAVFTVAQAAGGGAGRSARQVTITTADASVAAGDVVMDLTKIEGYNIVKYVGNTFTIAFRAKVPVAGIHCVSLRNLTDDRSYVKEINFPVANVWQDCSLTVVGGLPTAGTWNYTNGTGLTLAFTHMCGTVYQTTPDAWQTGNFLGTVNQVNDCATNGNVWALEKVTMNLGMVAAVSEIDVGGELRRCMRYDQFIAHVVTTTSIYSTVHLPVEMRATPSITQTFDAGTGATFAAFSFGNPRASVYQNTNHSSIASASVRLQAKL